VGLRERLDRLERDADPARPVTVFCIPFNGRGGPGPGVYESGRSVTVIYDANDPPPEVPAGVPLADALERLAVTLAAAVAGKATGSPGG
jgi:hypothetical protein